MRDHEGTRYEGTRAGEHTRAQASTAVPPMEAAREVTRIAKHTVDAGDTGYTGEMLGALLVSAGHAACSLEMNAQEFCSLASRYYAHAQRVRRVHP